MGMPVTVTVNVENTAPTIGAVTMDPAAPNGRDNIQCQAADIRDPDPVHENLGVVYTWTVNGQPVETVDGLLLATRTTRDDEIQCTATVNDGVAPAVSAQTGIVSILNTPPSIELVYIDPGKVFPDTDIECVYEGFRDADNDGDASRIIWFVDDRQVVGNGNTLSGPFETGDVIKCQVIPSDIASDGQPVEASVVVDRYRAEDVEISCLNPSIGQMGTRAAFDLKGAVTRKDIIDRVTVDGQIVNVDENGRFTKRVADVDWGINTYEIIVTDNDVPPNTNRTFCSAFAAARYLSPAEHMNDTVLVHLTQAAVDDGAPSTPVNSMADLLRKVLESNEINRLLNENLSDIPRECRQEACVNVPFVGRQCTCV